MTNLSRRRSSRALALAAILVPLLAHKAQASDQQNTPDQQRRVATYRTLQIDTDVRPEPLQFVQADDGNRYLVYNLFVANWAGRISALRGSTSRTIRMGTSS